MNSSIVLVDSINIILKIVNALAKITHSDNDINEIIELYNKLPTDHKYKLVFKNGINVIKCVCSAPYYLDLSHNKRLYQDIIAEIAVINGFNLWVDYVDSFYETTYAIFNDFRGCDNSDRGFVINYYYSSLCFDMICKLINTKCTNFIKSQIIKLFNENKSVIFKQIFCKLLNKNNLEQFRDIFFVDKSYQTRDIQISCFSNNCKIKSMAILFILGFDMNEFATHINNVDFFEFNDTKYNTVDSFKDAQYYIDHCIKMTNKFKLMKFRVYEILKEHVIKLLSFRHNHYTDDDNKREKILNIYVASALQLDYNTEEIRTMYDNYIGAKYNK